MAESDIYIAEQFDLTLLNTEFVVSTKGRNVVSFQVDTAGAALTGVLTLERSLNGVAWAALSTPTTIAAVGITTVADCSAFPFIRARVTTAQAIPVRLSAYTHDARK